jgi:orotate phosphoribosyltransferase
MDDMGITLHTLTTFWDVLAVARDKNYFDNETLDEVEKFFHAPDDWSAAHGGQIKDGVTL